MLQHDGVYVDTCAAPRMCVCMCSPSVSSSSPILASTTTCVGMETIDVVEQISSLTRFFTSQVSLLDRDLATRSEAALVTSIAQQISSLRSLDVAGAASINYAISSSTMSLPLKAQLAAAATRRAFVAQTVTPHRRTCQTLQTPCAFFTEGDWQCFEDATIGVGRKVMIMADRMHRLGLTTPSEMTTKHFDCQEGQEG